jgi:type IV secretory pathway TrbL component
MYVVEYRRFYLRDLESIVIWPNRAWVLRPIIPGAILGALAAALWHWANFVSGAIAAGIGLAWVALELALGPTAKSRIQTTGASVELPLVKRTRRAQRVLARIDAAVRAARSPVERAAAQPARLQVAGPSVEVSSEAPSAAAPIGDLTQANGS